MLKYIIYALVALLFFWAGFCLVRHFRRQWKGGSRCSCGDCSRCCEGCCK